jgi:SAM-dependent methyltransferase
MLVSDLIKFRDDILARAESIPLSKAIDDSCVELECIISSNPAISETNMHEKIKTAITDIRNMDSLYQHIVSNLISIIDDIYQIIDDQISVMDISPDTPYKKNFKVADAKSFRYNPPTDIFNALKSRINQMSDWHFPGMQLGCRSPEVTAEAVGCDPLYLCDFNFDYIDLVSDQFNDIYNRRLRKYIINDHQFSHLPQNQFGFVFSWMFFNFAEINEIELYLKEIFKILRPGGVVIFSYNNGDIVESSKLFESGIMSFVPKRKLLPICKEIGFEIVNSLDSSNYDSDIKIFSWAELKKPGVLSTVKRSQAQGLIGRK